MGQGSRAAVARGWDRDAATTVARSRADRRRDAMRTRLRAQARPHVLMWGLAGAGTVASWVGAAVPSPGTAGALVAGAGAVATAAAVSRRRCGTRARPAVLGLGAAGWAGWVTAAGMGWDPLAALLAGGYAAALPWWRRHRLPDPPEVDAPESAEVNPLDPVRLWAAHVARDGGPLPGTKLTSEERLATGLRYDVALVPGRHALADVRQASARLRSGLRLRPGQDLVVEQHPTADEATVRITLVQRSPVLSRPTPWPGPTYDPQTGRVGMGPYVDGVGVAQWRLAQNHRLYGGFLVGSTGSGKSRAMEALALSAATGAGCVIWFGDPQGGASSPFLADRADWVARDVGAIRDMLAAANQVKRLRQVDNALSGREGWSPGDYPGLLVIIDECHEAMKDQRAQELATTLAREGGKVGIALVLASQVPTLDAFGAKQSGQRALRGSVVTGNLVLLRVADRGTGGILPGLAGVDPADFPSIPGYAYLVDSGDGTRRSAPFRGYYLTDEVRDQAAGEVTWPELDPASAAAAGSAYRGRRLAAEADRDTLTRELEALARGVVALPPAPPVPAAKPAVPAAVPEFPPLPTAGAEGGPGLVSVLDRPAAPPVTTAVEAVAKLLDQGVTAPGEIQQRSGYGETAVRQALRELAQQGRARRVRHGVWQPTTTSM